MESLFYVGQKIVAIKDHSSGHFEKGDEFTVLDINEYCKCGCNVKIFQGELVTHGCAKCNTYKQFNGYYYAQEMFAPLQELSEFTFEEAIKMFDTFEEKCLNHIMSYSGR